jgi:hypothetical protein
MIFAVRLEMILELQNTLTQDCYLYLWRTGIRFMNSVCCNYLFLGIGCQRHSRIDTPRLNLISFLSFTAYHKIAGAYFNPRHPSQRLFGSRRA